MLPLSDDSKQSSLFPKCTREATESPVFMLQDRYDGHQTTGCSFSPTISLSPEVPQALQLLWAGVEFVRMAFPKQISVRSQLRSGKCDKKSKSYALKHLILRRESPRGQQSRKHHANIHIKMSGPPQPPQDTGSTWSFNLPQHKTYSPYRQAQQVPQSFYSPTVVPSSQSGTYPQTSYSQHYPQNLFPQATLPTQQPTPPELIYTAPLSSESQRLVESRPMRAGTRPAKRQRDPHEDSLGRDTRPQQERMQSTDGMQQRIKLQRLSDDPENKFERLEGRLAARLTALDDTNWRFLNAVTSQRSEIAVMWSELKAMKNARLASEASQKAGAVAAMVDARLPIYVPGSYGSEPPSSYSSDPNSQTASHRRETGLQPGNLSRGNTAAPAATTAASFTSHTPSQQSLNGLRRAEPPRGDHPAMQTKPLRYDGSQSVLSQGFGVNPFSDRVASRDATAQSLNSAESLNPQTQPSQPPDQWVFDPTVPGMFAKVDKDELKGSQTKAFHQASTIGSVKVPWNYNPLASPEDNLQDEGEVQTGNGDVSASNGEADAPCDEELFSLIDSFPSQTFTAD